ncbi:Rv1733c family protein [Spirillospora sp. NBC_01491]|uniref:Rv1733c family protein n=1 Tax=Spirillospora sp. NBC_01491 TaxID=2976007 RepID=UPI002E311E0E|nr:hypothetical protein [Spirillospora sp. NBC_01491]
MSRFGAGPAVRPSDRLRRRLGLERNDLRRRVDRFQRLIALVLLLVLLAAAPPLAAWAAGWSYRQGSRAERAERIDRHQVVATVQSTGGIGSVGDRYVHETVRAQWPGPGGKVKSGSLPSWQDAKDGARRQIWIDREGEPTVRPRAHNRTLTDAAYAGFAGVLVAGLPLLLAYGVLRRRCDRYRDALWEADWARMDADAGRNRPS